MANSVLTHLKNKGHTWVIILSVITVAAYVTFGLFTKQTQQELIANSVLILVGAGTVYGGSIALWVLATLNKEDCGELADFRNWIVLGLLVGIVVAFIQGLSLFGIATEPLSSESDQQVAPVAPLTLRIGPDKLSPVL